MARSTWGTIRAKSKDTWELRYSVGKKRQSKIVRGTKKDAERKLAELRLKYENNSEETTTLDSFSEIVFFPECEKRVKDGSMALTTFTGYKNYYKATIKEEFGDCLLEDIRPRSIQAWLNNMSKGKARHAKALLSAILNRAVALEYLEYNVADRRYIMPTENITPRTKDIYHEEELNEIFNECQGTFFEPAFIMAAFGGGQRAEVMGTKPKETLFKKQDKQLFALVQIKRGVHLLNKKIEVSDHAKNKLREAALIIGEPYSIRLKEITKEMIEEGQEWYMDDGFGNVADPEAMTRTYKKWLSNSKHKYIPFSNLRNAYSTMLHTKGYPDALVKKLMRHSSGSKIDFEHYNRPDETDLIKQILVNS